MPLPSLGPLELVLILAIALLILGPRRLGRLGSAAVDGLRRFRREASDSTDDSTTAKRE